MFQYQVPPDIKDLIQQIGSKNIDKSFDAQLIFCDALQPLFNFEVFMNKTRYNTNLGIKIYSSIDLRKLYAKELRFDFVMKCFGLLVDNTRSKMEKYNTWCDCMLLPQKNLPDDRFGIEVHVLI
jgi:hypothetical protein